MESIDIYCKDCDGTGLYKGLAEQGKSAVICYTCKGTGKIVFSFETFSGRRVRKDIKRVFRPSQYVVSHKDVKADDGTILHFSKFGCSYEEFLDGVEPRPLEELMCPYECFNMGIGNEPLKRCRDKENKNRFGEIKNCTHHKTKAICWEEFREKNPSPSLLSK